MAYPETYKYTKEHEWIEVDGTTGTIGITDYAQSSLGDIVFVELPKVGDKLTAHETFGSVESVKAVSDLYSPVAGTVTEVNSALNDAPETINTDANSTWLVKVALTNAADLDSLLDSATYTKYVEEETGH
ncbi:glycine cleavage system protein GcvH [Terriglobus saanensis]|uniref:Glycine cleavage system H protein n=1 Tax=Terriglobus saanensis (strain ATCC BAA-1853 / DSM 23119 / SP1PR4) TaxID=401053 RepID=E8V622_TERSS|nr:glycine cleavage system protein GcvH [Terriglobus saanensis]ADV83840.1 glycine cleavage system H protein [Terriglobus saanensis SP1PR4]